MTKERKTKPACHAELVSASGWFFLLSADASFIPVHRKGFSDAILIKNILNFFKNFIKKGENGHTKGLICKG